MLINRVKRKEGGRLQQIMVGIAHPTTISLYLIDTFLKSFVKAFFMT